MQSSIAMAAESVHYVNVRKSKVVKESEPQHYTNVELQNKDGQCEEYQIVQERGRDPNGEYTVTTNSTADKVSEDTLRRQKMIHSLLFPSQTQVKRFDYTDIQLSSNTQDEVEQPTTGGTDSMMQHNSRSKPQVKPKPKLVMTDTEREESPTHSEELSYGSMNEQDITEQPDTYPSRKTCILSWKCTTALFLTLFLVSFCISLVATSVAVTAFTKFSQTCDEDLTYSSCMIRPTITREDDITTITNNSCDTSVETVSEDLKVLQL